METRNCNDYIHGHGLVSRSVQEDSQPEELPSLIAEPLGIKGWQRIEPVLLAGLATQQPMLLISPPGGPARVLTERLAAALGLNFQYYNGSQITCTDLLGAPGPNEQAGGVHLPSATSSPICDAEFVLLDQLSRARPDLQSMFLTLIRDRRIHDMPLERLRYRWASIAPPPVWESTADAHHFFDELPLDPVLARRFAFIVTVPWDNGASDWTEESSLANDHLDGGDRHPDLSELVRNTQMHLRMLRRRPLHELREYVYDTSNLLKRLLCRCDRPRSASILRKILAVHAARITLHQCAHPDQTNIETDWETSAILALRHGLFVSSLGVPPEPCLVITIHRLAWTRRKLDRQHPVRIVLRTSDPLERCFRALEMADRIDDFELAYRIVQVVKSARQDRELEPCLMAIYDVVRNRRDLFISTYAALADTLYHFLTPGYYVDRNPYGRQFRLPPAPAVPVTDDILEAVTVNVMGVVKRWSPEERDRAMARFFDAWQRTHGQVLPPERIQSLIEQAELRANVPNFTLFRRTEPVYGRYIAFSLPAVCLITGLLGEYPVGSDVLLDDLWNDAAKRWNMSVERFFKDLEKIGVVPDGEWPHSVPPPRVAIYHGTRPCWQLPHPRLVCTDIRTTLAVLARTAGCVFQSKRRPEYTWGALFYRTVWTTEIDAPAAPLSEEPWSRYTLLLSRWWRRPAAVSQPPEKS